MYFILINTKYYSVILQYTLYHKVYELTATYDTVMRPAFNAVFDDDDDGFCVEVTIGLPCGQASGLLNSKY